MCDLVTATEILKTYNNDINNARVDGAEREFLIAESVNDQYQTDQDQVQRS